MSTAQARGLVSLLAAALWLFGCDGNSEETAPSDSGGADSVIGDRLDDEDPENRPEVVVSSGDVARLYEVLNDPDFAGYRVVLEPGTYELERSLDPSGLGYLHAQRDMAIVGANEYRDVEDAQGNPSPDGVWDPWDASTDAAQFANPLTETIIDCAGIFPASHTITSCGEDPVTNSLAPACIALGPGNLLSRVTVRGSSWFNGSLVRFRPSSADSTAHTDDNPSGEISDCVVEGGDNAVSAGLAGCHTEGVQAHVTIARNMLRGAGTAGAFLWGGLFTRDVTLEVTLRDNRIEENHIFGVITYAGVSADRCELAVASSNNINRRNDVGGAFLVAFVDYPFVYSPPGGVDNHLTWTSRGDWITGNGHADGTENAGGVSSWAIYAHSSSLPEVSRNRADLRFFDTTFASGAERENTAQALGRADITALGHHGLPGGTVYPHNTVALELDGCRSDDTPVYFDHSFPDDPEGTNRVDFVGGSESLARDNEGIPGAVEIEWSGF
jgi:hypothetical protein